MNSVKDKTLILGIESSCDDTSCAITNGTKLLVNLTANQQIHNEYGGVVPELASRSHLKNIVPLTEIALKKAAVNLSEIDAIAYTRGPGLLGSLLVGSSYAKSLSIALNKPLIEVNHMRAHILAHFIEKFNSNNLNPKFPFLCLTVSGGHTQLVRVDDHYSFLLLGETIDDAVGEAFDKGAKILGLPYPGGPIIDNLALEGNPKRFIFSKPRVSDLNFSFSGIKTSLLYLIRDNLKVSTDFINNNLSDLCASYQNVLIEILLDKLNLAISKTGISRVALAGGVSANNQLRSKLREIGNEKKWDVFIPDFEFCTDNAAMIAVAGYFKYLKGDFSNLNNIPFARSEL